MSKRFTTTIEEDEFGDLILPIPDEVCEELGWTVGCELEYEMADDETFTLRKVDDGQCNGRNYSSTTDYYTLTQYRWNHEK